MPALLLIGLAVLAYLVYTGKISKNAIFPIVLGLAALFLFSRGLFPQGAITTAIAGFLGRGFLNKILMSKLQKNPDKAQSPQIAIPDDVIQARALLGVNADDDDDAIKRKYRKLLEEHHPDRGGDGDYARAINLAKDTLIKYHLNNRL